jgi:hypothetical protein
LLIKLEVQQTKGGAMQQVSDQTDSRERARRFAVAMRETFARWLNNNPALNLWHSETDRLDRLNTDALLAFEAESLKERVKASGKCPQCGEAVIFPRDSEAYCEECGWPDENRMIGEIGRWQEAIYKAILKAGCPDNVIDGAGCDSGDPLDFTLAEIAQGFNWLKDRHDESLKEAAEVVRLFAFDPQGLLDQTIVSELIGIDGKKHPIRVGDLRKAAAWLKRHGGGV